MDIELLRLSCDRADEVFAIERTLAFDAASRASVEPSLSGPTERVWGAQIDGELVGYLVADVAGDDYHILNVAVRSDMRRRGIGELLLRRAIADTKQSGFTRAVLEVRASNAAAIALYEKIGFKLDGVAKGQYSAPREDGRLYSCQLPTNL